MDESRRKYLRYYISDAIPPSLFILISNKFYTSQKFHVSEHSPSLSKPLLLHLNPRNIQNMKKLTVPKSESLATQQCKLAFPPTWASTWIQSGVDSIFFLRDIRFSCIFRNFLWDLWVCFVWGLFGCFSWTGPSLVRFFFFWTFHGKV